MVSKQESLSFIAGAIWPQGKPYAKVSPDGTTDVGKRIGLDRDNEHFNTSPDNKGSFIAIQQLDKRRKLVSRCAEAFDVSIKPLVIFTALVTLKSIKDKSLSSATLGALANISTWTSIPILREICDQTVESLDDRISLINEAVKQAHRE